ncbi:MAG: phosphotransferase [Verrucomicrobiaceae bacterium]|nr:phosphotransferase [Verrucomicrobiaceae bacterium]
MQVLDPVTTRQRLEGWLTQHIPEATDMKVSPVDVDTGGGFSAEIFFVRADYNTPAGPQSKELVVRRQASTYELIKGGDLRLQADMMGAMNKHSDVAVPEFIGMESGSELLGAPFLVMVRIDGEIAKQNPNYNLEGWLVDFTPEQRLQTWTNAIEAFASVHTLDWQDGFTFLNNPARGEPGLDQYLNWLEEWYRWAAQGREQPIADAALDYVLRNRPKKAVTNVLWGDPHSSNVMFKKDGSIAALIDWELAALGPGEIDLAWWLYFDELFSTQFRIPRLPGLPDRKTSIAIYEKAVGRPVEDMEYYDMIAGLRMSIIALRSVDRQIGLGKIKPTNKSVIHNFQTQHLARLLGMEVPELGPDFYEFMSFVIPVKEEEKAEK